MAVSNRFISNLEKAIKEKERYSSNLYKSLLGGSCSSKIKIRGTPPRLLEYISDQAVMKTVMKSL